MTVCITYKIRLDIITIDYCEKSISNQTALSVQVSRAKAQWNMFSWETSPDSDSPLR